MESMLSLEKAKAGTMCRLVYNFIKNSSGQKARMNDDNDHQQGSALRKEMNIKVERLKNKMDELHKEMNEKVDGLRMEKVALPVY